MTWRELKEKVNRLPDWQLDKNVYAELANGYLIGVDVYFAEQNYYVEEDGYILQNVLTDEEADFPATLESGDIMLEEDAAVTW